MYVITRGVRLTFREDRWSGPLFSKEVWTGPVMESRHHSQLECKSQGCAGTGLFGEYFKQLAHSKDKNKPVFDKVIIKDAIRYFEKPKECYANIMNCIDKFGKLLIIHRPGNLNTLPVFTDAKQRLEENEIPYMDIIKDLRDSSFDVSWEIENLPILMKKRKWFSMLREKFPPQMEILSDAEVTSGCRELTEGILKYEGETVEFLDRLLFISISHSKLEGGFPKIERHGRSKDGAFPNLKDLKLSMEVTPDIHKLLPKNGNGKPDVKNKFPWG
ncbi:hypothetical protein FSP39_013993 [Pinctada imbricata]|uniref:Uncharacterized protein n=1 Tax=Pinctada imbricata TaxID=66713 RepID=A0AA88XMF5_PINIB|nr:hypothetical protein FSP39_013993 [Pinctada imbricata]